MANMVMQELKLDSLIELQHGGLSITMIALFTLA